jgi:hypothetical protein
VCCVRLLCVLPGTAAAAALVAHTRGKTCACAHCVCGACAGASANWPHTEARNAVLTCARSRESHDNRFGSILVKKFGYVLLSCVHSMSFWPRNAAQCCRSSLTAQNCVKSDDNCFQSNLAAIFGLVLMSCGHFPPFWVQKCCGSCRRQSTVVSTADRAEQR